MADAARDREITEQLAPEPRIRAWIGDRLPGSGPFTVTRVTSGDSNEIFRLERDGGRWLLRRPPRVVNVAGANDMAREFRVASALRGSDVPHAEVIALCDDPEVIGAPFSVMAWVDGVRLYDGLPTGLDDGPARRRIGEELFDALAALHQLDWQTAGLDGLGRPDTFTQRQVGRWMKQYRSFGVREIPEMDEAAAWLEAHTPTMQRAALIHGDYGLHNVMYAPTAPVRLEAIVDWETATIGDPLIDLGYLLGLWLEGPEEAERWFATALPYDATGFPSRQEMAERYADRTGLDLSAIQWYRAVAQLKVAAMLEGLWARFARGDSDNPGLAKYERIVPNHAAYALAITRGEA